MNWTDTIRTTVYLGTGAAGFALAGAAALVFWWSPISPLSRDEPAILVSSGDLEEASTSYMQQAVGWGSDEEREEAMWRAAMLETVELGHRRKAIKLLLEFQETWPDSDHRVDGFAHLAELYLPGSQEKMSDSSREERLRKAAKAYEQAIRADEDHPNAGDWLVRTAGIWAELGERTRADATWRRASAYEEHRVASMLILANALLPESPERAYAAYMDVLAEQPEVGDATLARLGMATALERMERYDEAEQSVDLALKDDQRDRALTQRKRRLEAIQ